MLGSGVLDVAIGIVLMYLLLSLICSALTEGIARVLALRSSNLKVGIQNLLNDTKGTGYAQLLYDHPLIKGLYRRGRGDRLLRRGGKPSYIPSRNFALALLDIVAGTRKSLEEVRSSVATIGNTQVKYTLLSLLDEADDLKAARASIERWFNDAMERVSGWYRRKAQVIIFAVAVTVSVALNADTFEVASALWDDTVLREAVVAAAQGVTEQPLPNDISAIEQQLAELELPLGWHPTPNTPLPNSLLEWLVKASGLLFTAVALALGAPFWFDVLNKFVGVRSSGESPPTSPDGVRKEG